MCVCACPRICVYMKGQDRTTKYQLLEEEIGDLKLRFTVAVFELSTR